MKNYNIRCEAGHVTQTEEPKAEMQCTALVASMLVEGAQVPCARPAALMVEAEVKQQEAGTVIPIPLEKIGKMCDVCHDPKATFTAESAIVSVETDEGEKDAHAVCFWKVRADGYRDMWTQAHQTIAILVGQRNGGRAYVTGVDVERAQRSGFNVNRFEQHDAGGKPTGFKLILGPPLREAPRVAKASPADVAAINGVKPS